MKKIFYLCLVMLLLLSMCACGKNKQKTTDSSDTISDTESVEVFNWADVILGDLLPAPESNCGDLVFNYDDSLLLYVHNTSKEQYQSYISVCREKGFTIDVDEYDTVFTAKDEIGYELSLYYFESDEEMSISLSAPSESTSVFEEANREDNKETEFSTKDKETVVDESERTYEIARKFVELYNENIDPDILNTEEFITEDRILKYDEAYAIQGDIDGEYILIMNFGSWDIKDEMRIEMYADTPEEVFEMISNVSKTIGKPLTEDECNKTKLYLKECFTDEFHRYTEWTDVNSISYWSGYNATGDNYEVLIEFSIEKFYT